MIGSGLVGGDGRGLFLFLVGDSMPHAFPSFLSFFRFHPTLFVFAPPHPLCIGTYLQCTSYACISME